MKYIIYFPVGPGLVGGTAVVTDRGKVISADISPYSDVNQRWVNTIQTTINQLKRGKGTRSAKEVLCVTEGGHKKGQATTMGKLFDPRQKRQAMLKIAKSLSQERNRNVAPQPIDSKGVKNPKTSTPSKGMG